MDSTLDVLARAFYEADPRLAVFDTAARRRTGLWHLEGPPIPIDEIVGILRTCEAFHAGEHLLVPLHDRDTAELTGGYVLSTQHDREPYIGFYDFSQRTPLFLPSREFGETTLALHTRFWHPDHRPPGTPSYLAEHYSYRADRSARPSSGSPAGPTTVDPSFFEDIKLSIARERDAVRDANRERYLASRGRPRADTDGGIPRLNPVGRRIDRDWGQICMLELPAAAAQGEVDIPATYGIYPGAEVLIDAVDRADGFPVEAEVVDIAGGQLDLHVRWSTADNHAAAESAFDPDSDVTFRAIQLLNPIPYDRQRSGVESIEADDRKRAIVLGEATVEFDDDQSIGSRSRSLNQYQRSAIRRALGASDIFCIHGPPGTGKTRTLVSFIREAVYRGEKVLACAHSNQAVDNLLVGSSTLDRADRHSLHANALADELVIARAGRNSTNDVVKEYYTGVESWEANVVGATTSAAHQFRTDEFDVVVVDEATQCGIPSTMIPFSSGRRLILAGDHKQLPPYTSRETDTDERMEISLFEHFLDVYGDEVSTLLRKQYRMNERIAAFPNRTFYGGKLTHGQRNRDWTVRDLAPIVGIHVEGSEGRTPGGSYYNEREASVVAGEVRRLLQNGVPAGQIGIITPYSGQVGKIMQAIEDPDLADRLTVSTVDAFQGSERDAIVVSFVRSNPEGNIGFLGFPTEGPRRLNVAMTRAKKRCTLIGDWETLRRAPPGRTNGADASPIYDALYAHLLEEDALSQATIQAH